jgi:hypothetical protein
MDKIWSLFSRNSNILKFLLSPVRFTKFLGVHVPLCPPGKNALIIFINCKWVDTLWKWSFHVLHMHGL